MKPFFLLLTTFSFIGAFAQNKQVYGKFTCSNGTTINGTSTKRGFEKQVFITSYTGGSDNSATIEIEVPTSAYVGEFRNIMNAAPATNPAPVVAKVKATVPTAGTAIGQKIGKPVNLQQQLQPQQQPRLTRAEITVANIDGGNARPASKIILENIKIESCTDNAASGTSKIKLKGTRIGWIYYQESTGAATPPVSTKSGWDVIAGTTWNNF